MGSASLIELDPPERFWLSICVSVEFEPGGWPTERGSSLCVTAIGTGLIAVGSGCNEDEYIYIPFHHNK